MEMKLQRDICGPTCTEGTLYVDGVQFCYTMEDTDRRLESGETKKIQNFTAIPRGRYSVVLNYSNRFQKIMPPVLDVPGFAGIRIHSGNTAEDTEGCILVGSARGEHRVLNSRAVFAKLMVLLEDAHRRDEPITLTVA